jgi:hypothetical protein
VGRTPAALRRAGNPRIGEKKANPSELAFFEDGAPGRVSTHRSRSTTSRGGERPPRCGGPEIPASAKKKPTHQDWLFLNMARPEG